MNAKFPLALSLRPLLRTSLKPSLKLSLRPPLKRPIKIAQAISILSIATSSHIAVASDQSYSALEEELSWLKEESYVEAATKTKEHINKSGASVSVITDRQLAQMGASNLMDALGRLTGFNVQTTNIGIPSISVRGAKTDSNEKILFLINGHSINNNLVNGGATWTYNDFPIDNIKRVEVVRGPGSALYGTSALVAIINIVTKKAEDITHNSIKLGIGSDRTRLLNVQTAGQSNDLHYAFNANLKDTEGTEEFVAEDPENQSGYTIDQERRLDLSLHAQYKDFSVQAKLIDRESGPFIGIGNALNDESAQDYLEYFVELSHQYQVNSSLGLSSKLSYDFFEANNYWEIRSEGFGGGAFPDGLLGSPTVKNEKLGGELQALFQLGDHNKLLAGTAFEHHTQFDVKHYTNFNPNTFAPLSSYQDVSQNWNWNSNHQRNIRAFFVQNIWDANEDVRVIIGARDDHYSDFGRSLNPRASLTWQLTPDHRITSSYGKAFRAPNFGELYNVNNPAITGNPNLKAERIETIEFSFDTNIDRRSSLKATFFDNHIKNLIVYEAGVATNRDRQETAGLELELKSRLESGSSFNVNYTYQYPENRSDNTRAPGIPMHTANASYTYRHSRNLYIYLAGDYRGDLIRASGDSRNDIDEVSTFDLALNWQNEKKNVKVTASIYNLFDRNVYDYAESVPSDFPGEGRRFGLSAELKL